MAETPPGGCTGRPSKWLTDLDFWLEIVGTAFAAAFARFAGDPLARWLGFDHNPAALIISVGIFFGVIFPGFYLIRGMRKRTAAHARERQKVRRKPGSAKGRIWMAPDFDETPEEFKDGA